MYIDKYAAPKQMYVTSSLHGRLSQCIETISNRNNNKEISK